MIDIRDHGGIFGGGKDLKITGETEYSVSLDGPVKKGHLVSVYVDSFLAGGRMADGGHKYADVLMSSDIDIVETPDGVYALLTGSVYRSGVSTPGPGFLIYKVVNDSLVKLPDPDVLLPQQNYQSANSGKFSPDGQYFAVISNGAKALYIYKRNGDTFTKLANPTMPVNDYGVALDWSPDGNYLAVGIGNTSPHLCLFKRSGDTFTNLPLPSIAHPGGILGTIAFSPNGKYIGVGSNNNSTTVNCISVYKLENDTLTYLAFKENPRWGYPSGFAFTPDSKNFVLSGSNYSDNVYLYSIFNDVAVHVDTQAAGVGSGSYGVTMSPDGTNLMVGGYSTGKCVRLLKISDTNKLSSVALPSWAASDNAVIGKTHENITTTPSGQYTAALTDFYNIRHFAVYRNSIKAKKITNLLSDHVRRSVKIGYAMEDGNTGDVKKIKVLWGNV